MHTWGELFPRLLTWGWALFEGLALCLVPVVVLRRKEPSSTIAWILTLVFLPAAGAFLFLLFGRDRVRWPAKRKRQADALVRAQLEAAWRDLGSQDYPTGSIPPDPGEQQIFRIGSTLTGAEISHGNAVDVLAKGDDVYRSIGEAIDGARHHVHAQCYLIRNDATGQWFRDRLASAAKRGVQVQLLCDGYGCLGLPSAWYRTLKREGVRTAQFLPMRTLLLQPVNLRNHRKILVVDGTIAFSGGVNIGDEYRGTMPKVGAWRDTHLRIEGPAAKALHRVFLQDWCYTTGEVLDPAPYSPSISIPAGTATIAIIPSGPDTRTEAIHRLFFAAIAGASERVWITTPYFVPDQAILIALQVAAMRGVDVKLILPSRSNHRVTFHAGRSFYEQLLDAGVRIHEYQPGMIHAKTMIVDRKVMLLGSANMDMRSFRQSFEVHALIHDAPTARSLETCFQNDLVETRAVTAAEWLGRPWSTRAAEGIGRFVSPLL
jgi:cardiolipin synthase A/B